MPRRSLEFEVGPWDNAEQQAASTSSVNMLFENAVNEYVLAGTLRLSSCYDARTIDDERLVCVRTPLG
eukprot:1195743-Prorocentrum_minimum.AAC.6